MLFRDRVFSQTNKPLHNISDNSINLFTLYKENKISICVKEALLF